MITVTNFGMRFGQKILFENINLQLNKGNRYGMVGANGSGKTTLLKILSGEIQPESGEINYPTSLKLGVLKQDHFAYESHSILDVVLMGRSNLWNALQEKNRLARLSQVTDAEGEKLGVLEEVIADCNGYQAEADASEMLAGLGIAFKQQHDLLGTLSGGYKLRVLLAQCLFSEPDFLLLDEPTNHLDLGSILWLECYLTRFPGTCLIVSHDQYFLNHVSTHIIDIDYETVTVYRGNFQKFQKAKELEKSQKETEIVRQEKKKDELQKFVDRFKAKATKARQANSKAKQLDRMEDIVIKRSSRISPNFKFEIQRPSGKIALSIKKLSKSFNDREVLNNISLNVKRGEKIAIIGPNGIGKSTVLKILADKLDWSAGAVDMGFEIHRGYCPQDHQEIVPRGTTPYEWLYSFAPGETIGTIRGLLARVLLQGDDVHKATELLSGGESARLIFAKLMLQKPNLMLLDEPTNHMDIESLEALSLALKEYQGTIICVSHDRRFIETFASGILELEPNGLSLFSGDYQEYLEKQGVDYLDRTVVRLKSSAVETSKKRKPDSNERRKISKEISRLERSLKNKEARISRIEEQISEVEKQLADNTLYQPEHKEELSVFLISKENLNRSLETVTVEWEGLQAELDERSCGISS